MKCPRCGYREKYEALLLAARNSHVYHRCLAATGGPVCELCAALSDAKPQNIWYERAMKAEAALESLNIVYGRLKEGLEESVKLQSHYADLLNTYDDGLRIQFKDADDWLARLAMTPEERRVDAARRLSERKTDATS